MHWSQRQALVVAGAVGMLLLGALLGAAAVSTVPASGDISVSPNTGTVVTYNQVSEMPSGNIFRDTDGDGTTDGVITADGGVLGGTTSTGGIIFFPPLDDGTYAQVDTANPDGDMVFINASGQQRIEIRGAQLTHFGYKPIDYSAGTNDIEYATSGTTDLTFTDVPTQDDGIKIVDGSGTLIDYGVVSSSEEELSVTGSGTTRLDADVSTFNSTAPTISDASPTGPVNDDPVTLQADIGDDDLPADNVSVTIDLDGSQVSQQWVNDSDSTVSHTLNSVTAGSHSWTVTATDKYGDTTSKSYTFGVPDTLFIRNETNASQLVDSPTEVQVTFFAENGSVYTRKTTTGKVDMRGLPATEDFYVQANADGYRERTVYLESLIEQQTVYLLNESVPSATIVFELDDATGRFPPSETTLFVEKPINVSGSTEYRVIVSDQFGAANEIVTDLENNQRYRLRVESPEGETRILGNYKTAGDARAVLPIGQVTIGNPPEEGPAFNAELIDQNGQAAVRIVYRDTADKTDDLRLEIHETNDPSTVIRANTSESGPFGVYSETFQLPAPYNASSSLTVQYHANRSNAADTGDTVAVGEINSLSFGNLDGNVLSLAGWVGLVAVAGFTAPISGALGAMATVIFASFLAVAGVLSIPGALLGLAGATAVLFAFGGRD
jgi:hypothetical protein